MFEFSGQKSQIARFLYIYFIIIFIFYYCTLSITYSRNIQF